MKKMKLAVLLVMVFVLALQSVGMMPAAAEDAATAASVNDLTVEYIFNGLGDALNYGIVAEEYKQLNHAETSVYVDKLYKYHPDPFLNTQTTYMYGQAYPLYATVSAPAGETLLDMQFALFTANGDSYTMVEDTLYTVTEDTNVTAVGWKLPEDSPYLYKNLYIRQVEEKADGSYAVIAEGSENSAELEVHYGPSVSSAAPSSSYIGEIVSNQYTNAIVIYNTKEHNPPITFGPGNRLVVWQRDQGPMGGIFGGYWIDVSGTNARANTSDVYLEYENEYGYPMYAKLDGVQYEVKKGQGAFYANVNGEKLYLDISFTKETGKAAALLKQATTFSETIGNMTGGTIIHDESKGSYGSYDPSILGNSTVTGPEDENGNVVSLYNVALGDDWDFDEWDLKESIGQQKLLIAPNEYVVFNIVCPAPTGDVIMHPNAENMYIPAAGKEEQTMWGEEDSGASDRVLFNFIYKAEDGTYKPFEGTVKPSNSHGGTLLVPQGSVENDRNPHNGAMIAKYVENNGKEIHQRTMTSPAQTSWVNMLGDSIVTTGAIKIVKKNGTTGELLGGVEFSIYTDEQCTTLLAQEGIENPVSTDATTGAVLIDGLDPGTYYIQESKPQDGYAANDKVYTVEVKAGVTSLVGTKGYVENFKGRGTLRIVKVEEGNVSVKLQGAVFEIYTCKGESFDPNSEILLYTRTTNAKGEFEIRLDAGDYWIKEIYTPFGYVLDSTPIKVTVVTDGVALVGTNGVVTNGRMPTGTLTFTKVDADDNTKTLQDAEFGIYADAACSELLKTFKTAADGTVNLEVPVGTYYVQEITAPTNYQLDDTVYPVLIEAGATTQIGTNGVVANEYGTGKLWLKKIEEAHGKVIPLAGAWFGVYQDDVLITTGVTDDKGYVELEVPINNGQSGYVVKEMYAPIGYVNSNFSKSDLWITKAGEVKQVEGDYWPGGDYNGAISNTKSRETGKLVLFKNTWDIDPNGLPADGKDNRKNVVAIKGAVFGVYFDEACEMPIDGSPFTTDKDGRISVEGLTPGKYWLKELKAADGYVLDEEKLSVDVKQGPGESRVPWTDTYGNEYRWVYNAVDNAAHATLGLTKTLELVDNSVSMSGEYTFDFTMTLAASSAKTTGYTINDGDESVIFSSAETQSVADAFKVTFNEAGVYTFEVKETEGSSTDYIIYDKTPHTVVYTVTEETDGKLTVSSSVAGGNVSFTNKYNKVNISGFKIWEDGEDDSYRLNIDKDTFSPTYLKLFTLNADNSMTEFTELNINNKDSTKTAKLNVYVEGENGNFSWYYEGLPAFDADGNELQYVVKEMTVNGYQTFYINPSDSYSYRPDDDTALYPRPNVTGFQIHNILSKGELTIEKTVNYEDDAPAQKEFQFTITPVAGLTGYHFVDAQGNELTSPVTLTMDYTVGKTATLPVTILFDTFEDTSKTFTFTVAEAGTAPAGWTYDTDTTTVTYTVTRTEANAGVYGKQAVTVTVDETSKGKASFTNTYEEVKFQQGEFYIYKSLWVPGDEKPEDYATSFNFIIQPNTTEGYSLKMYPDGDETKKTELTPVEGKFTVTLPLEQSEDYTNVADQQMMFDVIFTEAGTYTFEVYEVLPESYPANWEYDDHHMTVTFKVAADGSVEKTTTADDPTLDESLAPMFYNEVHEAEQLDITKYWDDACCSAAKRPSMTDWAAMLTLRYAEYPLDKDGEPDENHKFAANEWKPYSATPSVVSDGADTWVVTYEDLPSYIDGKKVTWSVVEDDIDGYDKDYDYAGEHDEGEQWATFSITNTCNLTSVTVSKIWYDDKGNIDITANQHDVKDYLELYILTTDSAGNEKLTLVTGADGKTPLRPDTVTPLIQDVGRVTNNYTWTGVRKLNAGEQYVVKEDRDALRKDYPGAVTSYNSDPDHETDYEVIKDGVYGTIFNKFFERRVFLVAEKLVDGAAADQNQVFTFKLVRKQGTEEVVVDTFTNDGKDIKIEIKYGINDLPAVGKTNTYTYALREVASEDGEYIYDTNEFKFQVTIDDWGQVYTKLWNEATGAYDKAPFVDDLDDTMFTFNNETATSVKITKDWVDNDDEAGKRPKMGEWVEYLTLQYAEVFDADGEYIEEADRDWKAYNATPTVVNNVNANGEPLKYSWVATYTGLPQYMEGKKVSWSVVEDDIPGYTKVYDWEPDQKWGATLNIANTMTTARVSIQKIWYDKDGEILEDMKPDISQMLELYILHADGSLELVKDANGKPLRPVADLSDTYATFVWEGLTPLTNATDKYAVKENIDALREKFPDYVPSYYTDLPENEEDWLTYTFKGYETIEENGWGDVYNSVYDDFFYISAFKYVDGVEATEDQVFTFELKNTTTNEVTTLHNGEPFEDPIRGGIVTVPDMFSYELTYGADDLPKAGQKTVYDYELREVDPGDGKYIYDDTVYKFRVTIDELGISELTYWDEKAQAYTDAYVKQEFNNKSLTSVSVTKEWVGGKYADTTEPVTLTLYADGAAQTAKPTQKGNTYTWNELPMYNTDGKLIVYTVQETQVPDGYSVKYTAEVGEDGETTTTVETPDGAVSGGKIVNTYAAKGSIVLEGMKVLSGRTLKDGEFTFELKDAAGKVLQTKKNDKDGNIVFDAIEYTEADLSKSPIKYTISEVKGSESGMTYAANVAEVTVTLTDNGDGTIEAKADKTKAEIKFVNTYAEKVYEAKGEVDFDGKKVLNGRDLKAGEFTFILTDKNGKELQRVTNAADGTFAFEPIKYTETDVPYGKDAEFTYYITELAGDLPGVTYDPAKYEIVVGLWDDMAGTIHVGDISECVNEIVFTNTYEAKGEVTFKGTKTLLGREFEKGDEFTFELLNEAGTVIDTVTINPESGNKADFAFQTIEYDLADAGKTYTYTYRVKEQAGTEDGMAYDSTVHTVTVTVSDAGDGSLKVAASNNANALNFTNTYTANGTVLFTGTKTMTGKALAGDDFTFVLTDAEGKEIETVTNDKDGVIAFSAIQYELEDAGKTFTYKVYEKAGEQKGVTYDKTVYTVTVKVEDGGNGEMKVTTSDNATKLNFKNSYEAKALLTMNAYKTVNGYKPTVDQVYDFVLLCDDGTEMTAQNKDEVISFGTLAFDEDDIGKTFIYTVKETTAANELLDVDTAIYEVAVTVSDGGDGNLKLETEILKDGKRATGVVFANTATATLAISKTVKGPGPDKAFDLKVTFIGVDGKELEGVYDYDGDVKGTITSGGVIALKDGQSVTIVGLPEGATYTVEENAGPAYTVTVNGKPVAKAEGTLVGHGKLEFINTVEVTTFSVTKVWEGTDLGAITLTLYADGKQITPQPEVTREGDKYTYYNLPKYNDEGEEIVYSAKERGIDGYIRIYNNVEPYQDVTSVVHDGGTIINREVEEEVHELSFKIRKVWTGVEATEEIPAITLTLYCNGEKLDVPTPKPDSEGWYRYYDLPKTANGQIAVYTVVEEPIPGYTVTYKTASGEIVEEGVNGGEIVNAKIPQTGDPATLGLWLAMMGASAVLLTMLQRRRKA